MIEALAPFTGITGHEYDFLTAPADSPERGGEVIKYMTGK